MFQSTKLYDGFSTTFRQWKAEGTQCKFLHGYGVSFRIHFAGELDERNWVFDFGGMKRSKTKMGGMTPREWMDYWFDHTTIIAFDDPHLEAFRALNQAGIIQLRLRPAVGAERFAAFIFHAVNDFVRVETNNRVRVTQVTFHENQRNAATYTG